MRPSAWPPLPLKGPARLSLLWEGRLPSCHPRGACQTLFCLSPHRLRAPRVRRLRQVCLTGFALCVGSTERQVRTRMGLHAAS